jgi:hypothetical protein
MEKEKAVGHHVLCTATRHPPHKRSWPLCTCRFRLVRGGGGFLSLPSSPSTFSPLVRSASPLSSHRPSRHSLALLSNVPISLGSPPPPFRFLRGVRPSSLLSRLFPSFSFSWIAALVVVTSSSPCLSCSLQHLPSHSQAPGAGGGHHDSCNLCDGEGGGLMLCYECGIAMHCACAKSDDQNN